MSKLSTGDDSTLESYIKLCRSIFGENSKSAKYFEDKAAESPNGMKEEVLAHESQVMVLIQSLEAA